MRLAHSDTTPWDNIRGVRGGTIRFKTLLEGQEGRPDNYQLLLADTDVSFKSPRHRHNFDQLRCSVSGATNIGHKRNLEEGDLAYFPEGTYYGPQNQEEVGRSSMTLVIQFGGPSGNGYMSKRQMDQGFDALQTRGTFEGGVYKRHAPGPDGRKNQDAYEAIWEHQNGRAVAYSKPRFIEPIHFREANFEWQAMHDNPDAYTKHIGSFTERQVGVQFIRLDPGARCTLPAQEQRQLIFFKTGTGNFGAEEQWYPHTAADIAAGETPTLHASSASEALVLKFPSL